MHHITCRDIVISWSLVLAGSAIFYIIPEYGVLIAFIPFGIASKIRWSHDRALKERIFENAAWRQFALVYYLVLFVFAVVYARRIFDISIIWPVLIMFLPFIFAMVVNDISCCRNRTRNGNGAG